MIYEVGGAAIVAGVQFRLLDSVDGIPTRHASPPPFVTTDIHQPVSSLLCIENTHNRRGGAAVDADRVHAAARAAHSLGLRVHCDGARLFNAAVALGVQPGGAGGRVRHGHRLREQGTRRARSDRWSPATRQPSTRSGAGASASAEACVRPASSPPRDCTRSSTTSSGLPTTMPTRALIAESCWRLSGRHAAQPVGTDQHRHHRDARLAADELAATLRE